MVSKGWISLVMALLISIRGVLQYSTGKTIALAFDEEIQALSKYGRIIISQKGQLSVLIDSENLL